MVLKKFKKMEFIILFHNSKHVRWSNENSISVNEIGIVADSRCFDSVIYKIKKKQIYSIKL
jgi:hypothetical protein